MEGFKVPQLPPEVEAAVSYALREVSIARPENPIEFVAQKLRDYAAGRRGAAQVERVGSSAKEEEEPERPMRKRSRARRGVVFAPPVKMDAKWEPTVVPKTDDEKEDIRTIMSKNILFSSLAGDSLSLLIDVMVKKTFTDGEDIITQGAQGDFYYVLSSGTCDIFKDGTLVLQVSQGMGFGELAWAIDRISFKRVMMGSTTQKREKYADFLKGVKILASLTDRERLTIADALQPVEYKAGEDAVREGDESADRFFIVESGEMKGTKAGVDSEVCPRLTAGSYFGELALIKNQPRAATITAVAPTRCLVMDRAGFIRLLGPMNDILAREADLYAEYESQLRSKTEAEAEARAALDA